MRRILEIGSDSSCLILDSFIGSGTTAHAVLARNKADGGNRRFIVLEMDETICRDVTAQRIRKAIEGYGDTPGLGTLDSDTAVIVSTLVALRVTDTEGGKVNESNGALQNHFTGLTESQFAMLEKSGEDGGVLA